MGEILATWIGILLALCKSEDTSSSRIQGLGGGFIGGDG